MDTYKQYTLWT